MSLKIPSCLLRTYDDLILNLRAIFGKQGKRENKYFHIKEGGSGNYVLFAFVEKKDLKDDLLFLTTLTTVTSSIAAVIAKQE
ncbi:hypothetical protein FOPG_07496 [Fusarium oxysporum f. sp. conglutinans race 2 54008]|uniref:Uncharacterized protein n=1 Tax=Fusarium oxysporum f. sp. conglutinans race 2 54008 TaxID=1089457 RepID=X0IZD8_FUSOX|nr:hypothetical protein FOPG_07496 [Fusarium oxysporum f. sp. conglutinans race 2 54008]